MHGKRPTSENRCRGYPLHEKGIEFDLNQIKPENLEELIYQLKDLTVDIDDKNNKVRVFCE